MLCMSSCESDSSLKRVSGRYSYDCTSFSVPPIEGCIPEILDVYQSDDKGYMLTSYYCETSGSYEYLCVYSVDVDGNQLNDLSIDTSDLMY